MRATVTEKFLTKFRRKAYRDAFVENEVRTGLAYQVRILREQRKLSQEQLATLMGTTQSAVSRLEDSDYGRVSLSTLFQLAKALDVGLIARFCEFAEMIYRSADVSPSALEVVSFNEDQFMTHRDAKNIKTGFTAPSTQDVQPVSISGRLNKVSLEKSSSYSSLEATCA